MAVSVDSRVSVAANFADNLCRWDGHSRGHYEVWFLTLNQRAHQRGFWFRYTLEAPHPEQAQLPPRAELWATVFDRTSPEQNFGIVCDYPVPAFGSEQSHFRLRIAEALLTSDQARGAVANRDHRISWDLRFTPNATTYRHVPRALGTLMRPSSFVCSPNLDTRFTGVVTIDGRELELENEPGCQAHLWGSKHVDEWVWVHANAFEHHEGTVFEGLGARQRRAGTTLPPVQSLLLRHRGEEHHFVRLRFAEQWQSHLGTGFWSFSARNTKVYIEGTAQCRLRDMVQVKYVDPDGEPLYCLNSEVANLKLRIFRRTHGLRWRHSETINAHSTAHLEHAARHQDETVRLMARS
ncbi:MAG: hypothetical protein HY231_21730 [Acidobacteria bacterium]|nr:hypothetical protein [Acidobacteriota bacterium]